MIEVRQDAYDGTRYLARSCERVDRAFVAVRLLSRAHGFKS
jgi:hypothetical protein